MWDQSNLDLWPPKYNQFITELNIRKRKKNIVEYCCWDVTFMGKMNVMDLRSQSPWPLTLGQQNPISSSKNGSDKWSDNPRRTVTLQRLCTSRLVKYAFTFQFTFPVPELHIIWMCYKCVFMYVFYHEQGWAQWGDWCVSHWARCWRPWTRSLERNAGLPAEADHALARSRRGTSHVLVHILSSLSLKDVLFTPVYDNSQNRSWAMHWKAATYQAVD